MVITANSRCCIRDDSELSKKLEWRNARAPLEVMHFTIAYMVVGFRSVWGDQPGRSGGPSSQTALLLVIVWAVSFLLEPPLLNGSGW